MTEAELVGAWGLRSFRVVFDDGRPPVFPYGADAMGQIVYTPSGHMSAVLSRRHRELPGSHRLEDAHRASAEARAAAFDSYLSYAGTWRLEGDDVVHAVGFGLVPAAVGAEQRRRVGWDGLTLTLSYRVEGRSGGRTFELSWHRLEGAPSGR